MALQDFLSNATALILDQSSSSRPVLRRMLGELGLDPQKVKVAETYEEALNILEFHRPQIVFTDYQLGSKTALDMLRESARFLATRSQSVLIVISAENRPATTAALAEEEVDIVLIRPLVLQDLKNGFLEAVRAKAEPTPYHQAIEKGRKFLDEGNSAPAFEAFVEAKKLDPKPAKACYYEGLVHHRMGALDQALECYRQGLGFQKDHYRCLNGVFDVHMEQKHFEKAFEAGMALADHYPILPQRIPDMIRLCIHNDKFVEVLRFADAVGDLEKQDETLSRYVSAGLFICGKHLLRLGQRDEALKIFQKTEAVSKDKPKVLKEVLVLMFSGGMRPQAEEMLRRVPAEVSSSVEVRMAILEVVHSEGPDAKAFLMSQDLMREGVSLVRLFEIAILQARGLKRPDRVVEDLVHQASAAFPELKPHFQQLLTAPMAA